MRTRTTVVQGEYACICTVRTRTTVVQGEYACIMYMYSENQNNCGTGRSHERDDKVTYERNHPKGGINILEVIQIYAPNKEQNRRGGDGYNKCI